MLEFQEGFLEQEIRNGFYIDVTMKTVWAAELELLQKVAEVCNKYGLTWYAAYGTLLGAIRHEGFVPWDDDMDIWMKRKDYNKLMQVLPKELPEGFVVHSPLTEAGYDQYHTCVNTGTGVSISPKWLEQFHGCPFTVGLDIFPLDCVPSNEGERVVQENLFFIAANAAQMLRGLERGEFNTREGEHESAGEERKADLLEKITENIDYLIDEVKLPIKRHLLEEERWFELTTEMWKWANHIAMMYNEDEGDYLAHYMDYCKWKHKKYPKEWFAQVYSATFENFMLPIPCGYDCLLRLIYGEYDVCRRKSGMHEYPYYARQLREVRKLLKQREQEALGKTEEASMMLFAWEDLEVPKQWEHLVYKKDGTRKKIVLSANNPDVYLCYGDAALDKLESTLKQMEEVQKDVVFWWRPHPIMKELLEKVSPQLAERYQSILSNYKVAGWGICDETDNTERAVHQGDVYYGEMNAILQPFQNAGKPAVIAHLEGDSYRYSNEIQRLQYKGFCQFMDFVEKDGKVYMANVNYNELMIVDKASGMLLESISFEGVSQDAERMHFQCVMQQDKICFLPVGASGIHVYDIKTGEQKYIKPEMDNMGLYSWEYICSDNQVYLVPDHATRGLWRWNAVDNALHLEEWWRLPEDGTEIFSGQLDKDSFYTLCSGTNLLYITDLQEKKVDEIKLPDSKVARISYDGNNFWYVMAGCTDVVCWNRESGVVGRIAQHSDLCFMGSDFPSYSGICCVEDEVFVISHINCIYRVNKECQELQLLFTRENGNWGWRYLLKKVDDKLLMILQKDNALMSIDLEKLTVKEHTVTLSIGEKEQWKQLEILLRRGVLFYEEPDKVGLPQILQYYM